MTAPKATDLRAACEELSSRDAALALAYTEIGLPVWRSAPPTYANLARIIAYQHVSTKSASALWARLLARHPQMTPHCILTDDEAGLRSCGLSGPKIRHLRSVAEAVEGDVLNFEFLCQASLEEARNRLIGVKGIGPWTAEIFLMSAVGKMDAFPVADVGLMEAYKQLSGDAERLSANAFTARAHTWRPWRGVAAHLLWGWLNMMRDKNYP